MPTSQYWDTSDLKAVLAAPGIVAEDVLDKVWDLSSIPLPFSDLIGTATCENSYSEWITDQLAAPNLGNAVVSGSDATGNNAGVNGFRIGNHAQNSVKIVEVTERAISTRQFGRTDELSYQTMRRLQELKRDIEAIMLSPQASVQDDGIAVAGKSAGLAAWIENAIDFGVGGAAGGFDTATKLVDAPVAGTARALSISVLKDVISEVYEANGNPSTLMSVPEVIAGLNAFLLANPTAAAIAQPTANVQGSGGGVKQTAQGYVNVLVTDFNFTLELVPNRLQAMYTQAIPVVDVADVFLIDPEYAALGYLKAPVMHPIAKLGLADRRMISADWMLKVYQERAFGLIRDIDPALAVVA